MLLQQKQSLEKKPNSPSKVHRPIPLEEMAASAGRFCHHIIAELTSFPKIHPPQALHPNLQQFPNSELATVPPQLLFNH